MNKSKTQNNFTIWWGAHFLELPYWNVMYLTGVNHGKLLTKEKAKELEEHYHGKAYIDYQTVKDLQI
jgi:hypothetical protein